MAAEFYAAIVAEDLEYDVIGVENPETDTHAELVRVPELKLEGRRLLITYDIVRAGLPDEVARSLIATVLIGELYPDEYDAGADEIAFRNVRTGERRTEPFRPSRSASTP